jgi:hypothetical protein
MTPYNGIPNLFTDTIKASNGRTYNYMVYLDPEYQMVQLPMLFYWNGKGETSGDVSLLYKYFFQQVTATAKPPFPCVMLCVQGMGWADNNNHDFHVGTVQDEIYATLKAKFNTGPVVLTGISEGAMLASYAMYRWPNGIAKDVVLFVPMSSQLDGTITYNGWPIIDPNIAKSNVPVYGCGDIKGDNHASDLNNQIADLKKLNPSGHYEMDDTPGTGHGGWPADYAFTSKLFGGLGFWGLSEKYLSGAVVVPPTKTITGVAVHYNTGPDAVAIGNIKSVVVNFADGTPSETIL